jgi:hypothetical protein
MAIHTHLDQISLPQPVSPTIVPCRPPHGIGKTDNVCPEKRASAAQPVEGLNPVRFSEHRFGEYGGPGIVRMNANRCSCPGNAALDPQRLGENIVTHDLRKAMTERTRLFSIRMHEAKAAVLFGHDRPVPTALDLSHGAASGGREDLVERKAAGGISIERAVAAVPAATVPKGIARRSG